MTAADLLNDRNLVLLSAALTAFSFWADRRFPKAVALKGETWGALILRVAAGLILAGASLDKLGDPLGFYHHIQECFYFVPKDLQPLTAVAIPWVEFFTGVLLLVRFQWRPAALVFCVLMVLYTLSITWDVAHGIDCNCSCFDKTSTEKMTWLTVVRDLFFLAIGSKVLLASDPAPSHKNV
ncbi:MAG TPA: DoxX family protein [bacterium]|nr:DoxX family protein [bacterium]